MLGIGLKILDFLKSINIKYILMFALSLIALIATYSFGYGNAESKYKAAQLNEQKKQVQVITQQVEVAKEVEKTIYVKDLATVRKLEADKAALNNKINSPFCFGS